MKGLGYRESGLPAVGPVAWGTHVCCFYETLEDLRETVVPYFKAGLEQNERCVWVTAAPLGLEGARSALAAITPRLDERIAAGQMEIHDFREWFPRPDLFAPSDLAARWAGQEERTRRLGYIGLRVTGDTSWLADKANWDRLADFEEMVQPYYASHQIIALCSYSADSCSCKGVFDVVRRHQLALARRRGKWDLIENSALKCTKEELQRMNVDLEQRVSERTAELQAALRARDDFLCMAAHELRTPLAGLLLQLEGLGRPGKLEKLDPESERERCGKALANGRRLAQLIERMLDVSRLGHGPVPIKLEEVDLGALVREVVARLADQLRAAGCAVTLRESGELVGMWDRSRLDEAVTNLLVNAARHARGAPIEVDLRASGGDALVRVRDHGPGIPSTDRERVFEKFVQLRGGSAEGFGLGLWLVREIVAAHRGEVHVEEGEGGGARFVVRLPMGLSRSTSPEG
jgi:signal transduction histidine kinase